MARDLGDVLHWFLDEAAPAPEPPAARSAPADGVVTLAFGRKDVLRGAFAWNLAAALAERVPGTRLVTPGPAELPGRGSGAAAGGPEVVPVDGPPQTVAEVARAAAAPGAPVLACLPPESLGEGPGPPGLGTRALVFATPDEIEAGSTGARVARLVRAWPELRPGLTVHGVADLEGARRAFGRLAAEVEARLGRGLASYGLLLDDLDVYRSVVEREPLIRSRPHGRAAAALRDVAGWLEADLGADGGSAGIG